MDRSILVVLTNPTEGDDDEFNQWYDSTHLGEVLGVDGIVAAQRFRLAPVEGAAPCAHRYLALYELEGEPSAAVEALTRAAGTMKLSPTLDAASAKVWAFTPLGARTAADETG